MAEIKERLQTIKEIETDEYKLELITENNSSYLIAQSKKDGNVMQFSDVELLKRMIKDLSLLIGNVS